MFNAVPTLNQAPAPASEEGGHDNQATKLDVEGQVKVETQGKDETEKSLPAENGHVRVLSSVKM